MIFYPKNQFMFTWTIAEYVCAGKRPFTIEELPIPELEKIIVSDIKNGGIIAAEMEFITSELAD